jgi:dihydroxyacetone kinase
MEVGIGIHGEKGLELIPLESIKQIVTRLLDVMLSTDIERNYFDPNDLHTNEIVVLVNNLGSSTAGEMNIAAYEAVEQLQNREFNIERLYVGTYMSALDMHGFSISILRVAEQDVAYLDSHTLTSGWIWNSCKPPKLPSAVPLPSTISQPTLNINVDETTKLKIQSFSSLLTSIAHSVIAAEQQLNDLDSITGDGDCGTTLRRGADKLLHELSNNSVPLHSLVLTFTMLAESICTVMGGTSGAIYQILFSSAASSLANQQQTGLDPFHLQPIATALKVTYYIQIRCLCLILMVVLMFVICILYHLYFDCCLLFVI